MSIVQFQEPMKTMLTVRQAAQRLGLRESTLRAWILRRRLTFTRLGRAIRIPSDVVDRLIEDGTVPCRELRQ